MILPEKSNGTVSPSAGKKLSLDGFPKLNARCAFRGEE
jgi:hypothetical protein